MFSSGITLNATLCRKGYPEKGNFCSFLSVSNLCIVCAEKWVEKVSLPI